MIRIYIFLIGLILFSGCVSDLPSDFPHEPQQFTSGFITNEDRQITLKLQQTVPADEERYSPINDATMAIYTRDDRQVKTLVTDQFSTLQGEYTTQNIVTTRVGNVYWAEIKLKNGTLFRSEEEVLKPPVTIKDIEIESELIRVVFEDPADDINYYLLHFVYDIDGRFTTESWRTTDDILFDGNPNAFYEINESVGPGVRVTVHLYNLNFNTYQFHLNAIAQFQNQIENAEDGDGNPTQLFLPPPAHLTGNIINTKKNRRGLGYVGVSSVSSLTKVL